MRQLGAAGWVSPKHAIMFFDRSEHFSINHQPAARAARE